MFSRGAEAAEKSAPAKRGAPNPAILDKLHCTPWTADRQTRCFDLHATHASVARARAMVSRTYLALALLSYYVVERTSHVARS